MGCGEELIKQSRLASSASCHVSRKLPCAKVPVLSQKGLLLAALWKLIDICLLEAVGNYLRAITLSIQTATGIQVIKLGKIN